ncbi:hypothetical protein FQR65_LT16984 [Abscondita terminalis]|nr:hypothetical protein FQR65_LT16984 [Abscondita terminalis]
MKVTVSGIRNLSTLHRKKSFEVDNRHTKAEENPSNRSLVIPNIQYFFGKFDALWRPYGALLVIGAGLLYNTGVGFHQLLQCHNAPYLSKFCTKRSKKQIVKNKIKRRKVQKETEDANYGSCAAQPDLHAEEFDQQKENILNLLISDNPDKIEKETRGQRQNMKTQTLICIEQTLSFIEDYKTYSVLWDVNDKHYANKAKRSHAYSALAYKCNMTVPAIKNKIKSLRSYFSKEHQKVMERKSGDGIEDKYESPWFAYKTLLFIADSVTPRTMKDTIPAERSRGNAEEDIEMETQMNSEQTTNESAARMPETTTGTTQNQVIQRTQFTMNSSITRPPLKTTRATKKLRDDDEKEEAAFKLLKVAANELNSKGESSVFGKMVASQLRKLNKWNQAIAKNRIQNKLFELEMDELTNTQLPPNGTSYSTSSLSPASSPPNSQPPTLQYPPPSSASCSYSQPPTPQQPPDPISQEVEEYLLFNLDS